MEDQNVKTIKRTYKEAVEISVNWWIEKSFNSGLNQNNGDNSDTGGIGFLLMNMVSMNAQQEVTPGKINKFKTKLTELLLQKEGKSRYENELALDYHPCELLCLACDYAEINTGCLPIKTFTFINEKNEIEGSYQYGGKFFKI